MPAPAEPAADPPDGPSRRSAARRRSRRPPGRPWPTPSSGRTCGRATDDDPRRSAPRVVAERADWEELRLAGAAIKDEVLRDLPALLEQLEAGGRPRPAAIVHWARDAAEANAIVARVARGARRDRGRQGQVDGDPGDRAQRGAPPGGHRRLGDRPRRDDRPARPRPAVAHPGPGHPSQPDRDPRHLHRRDGPGRATRAGRPDRRSAASSPRPPGSTCARSSCARGSPSPGRTSRSPRPAPSSVVESEGNGRMCLTLPEVLITVMGIEKLVPTWRDLEVFLQLLPRSSTAERMNPYTSMWTGVTPGDGPQDVPPHPARQRPDRRPVRPGRTPGAALHPLLGLPQRLPGLRADRRSGLRVGLSRTDRRDPHPAAARASPSTRSTSRPRRCRSPRRCAAPASTSARSGSTSRRCSSTSAARSSATPRRPIGSRRRRRPRWAAAALDPPDAAPAGLRRARRRARRPAVRASRADPTDARPRARSVAGSGRATSGRPARESFRGWWRRTDGRDGGDDRARPRPTRRRAVPRSWRGSARRSSTGRPRVAIPRDYEHAPARPGRTCSTCSPSGSSDYRATVHRTDRGRPRRDRRGGARGARDPRGSSYPVGIPEAWLAGIGGRADRATTRRSRSRSSTGSTASITGCAVAIAETGTIVLDAGPGQGRRGAQPPARSATSAW